MEGGNTQRYLRLLCPKKSLLSSKDAASGLRWLIGSPLFLPPLTVVSVFRCLHTLPADPAFPDLSKEADELRTLLLRGFDVIGALLFANGNLVESACKAVEAASGLRNFLGRDVLEELIGASADLVSGDIKFFISHSAKVMEGITNVVYEDNPEEHLWENGCLLRCNLEFQLPIIVLAETESDTKGNVSSLIDSVAANLTNPCTAYLIEESKVYSDGTSLSLPCSHFCLKNKYMPLSALRESADAIQITVFSNKSKKTTKPIAPVAECLPASGQARLFSVNLKLDVVCYSSRDFPIAAAIQKLAIPGLLDQLDNTKKILGLQNLPEDPQLHPYHFLPSGLLHPVTAIYELRYGETEMKQAEIRKYLHSRLGLPLDRPLLRVANALNFGTKDVMGGNPLKYGSQLLKDVHIGIPSSGVSGGNVSLIDGSYEYYHYLLHGFDDNGWGCAYRSLQTIISWYRLQQYTSMEVPSHREIQQALVDIGDREPSFVGSREWIGAIELSFVLDKLLGVSCKIINVRSGEELPEKCRELSMHFETQGTPVMIGGGVLAYTLLGVDYNEVSGDCAFLILDPHYTGSNDLKKIVNGGWCGWKKAVDSKGRNFFLKDKFYNLLLPQRPNMV